MGADTRNIFEQTDLNRSNSVRLILTNIVNANAKSVTESRGRRRDRSREQ